MKGERPPGVPGWGKEVRGSRFNLIGVHPCRRAGDSCREATLICTNSMKRDGCIYRGDSVHGCVCGKLDGLCRKREGGKRHPRKHDSWSQAAFTNTSVCSKHQREKRTVPRTELSIPFICYLLLHPAQHGYPGPPLSFHSAASRRHAL